MKHFNVKSVQVFVDGVPLNPVSYRRQRMRQILATLPGCPVATSREHARLSLDELRRHYERRGRWFCVPVLGDLCLVAEPMIERTKCPECDYGYVADPDGVWGQVTCDSCGGSGSVDRIRGPRASAVIVDDPFRCEPACPLVPGVRALSGWSSAGKSPTWATFKAWLSVMVNERGGWCSEHYQDRRRRGWVHMVSGVGEGCDDA